MSKKITIELTEQQEHFLKLFAANHYPGATDNLCSCNPIHVVQTRRERVADPDYGFDVEKYVRDGEDYDSAEDLIRAFWDDVDCPIEIVSFDEASAQDRFTDIDGEEQVILDECDYLNAYGIQGDEYRKVSIEYYYEPVAFFFILAEARRYIEYQRHNLTAPRTYSYSPGYANHGDYEHFWDLLYKLGVMLNEAGLKQEGESDDQP